MTPVARPPRSVQPRPSTRRLVTTFLHSHHSARNIYIYVYSRSTHTRTRHAHTYARAHAYVARYARDSRVLVRVRTPAGAHVQTGNFYPLPRDGPSCASAIITSELSSCSLSFKIRKKRNAKERSLCLQYVPWISCPSRRSTFHEHSFSPYRPAFCSRTR